MSFHNIWDGRRKSLDGEGPVSFACGGGGRSGGVEPGPVRRVEDSGRGWDSAGGERPGRSAPSFQAF